MPFEQLHHVVEVALFVHAEIVDIDGVRGSEHGCLLRLAFETSNHRVPCSLTRSQHLRAYQLDRRRACQQPMLCPPHFSHSALAESLDQLVAADLARVFQPNVEPMNDACDCICDGCRQIVRQNVVPKHQ